MMYLKTPLSKQKPPRNRRVLSGGKPAANKKKSIFSNRFDTGGSAPSHGRRINNEANKKAKLPAFTPWKVILVSILIGACGILYIGHVFSTQQALIEVQQLESEYNKTLRLYNEKRLEYDRMVGPKEIYQQARERGFINAGPADRIIHLEP